MTTTQTINCPKCKTYIDVEKALSHQIERKLRNKYAHKENKLEEKENELNQIEINQQKLLDEKLHSMKKKLEKEISEKSIKENEEKIQSYEQELNELTRKVKLFHKMEAEMSRLKREKESYASEVKTKTIKAMNEEFSKKEEELKRKAEQELELKVRELEKRLLDQKKLTEEQKRKLEQGSMQLQGEIQELLIEDTLRNLFPNDNIQEIGKGQNGADIIQYIKQEKTNTKGSIYYESKRTKIFQKSWIKKFKKDLGELKADVGVIVTKTMPKGEEKIALIDGIYVCELSELSIVSSILRNFIIKHNSFIESQTNKSDKMSLMYDYLTSEKFFSIMKELVGIFCEQQESLNKEKNALMTSWKRREDQIERFKHNVTELYSKIRSISSNENFELKELELKYISL